MWSLVSNCVWSLNTMSLDVIWSLSSFSLTGFSYALYINLSPNVYHGPFLANFCTAWDVSVSKVLQLLDTSVFTFVHSPVWKVSSRSVRSGCTHFCHFTSSSIWLLPLFISNSKLFLYFRPKAVCGQISNKSEWNFISKQFSHFSMCAWRTLTLVKESCDSCWYSESS